MDTSSVPPIPLIIHPLAGLERPKRRDTRTSHLSASAAAAAADSVLDSNGRRTSSHDRDRYRESDEDGVRQAQPAIALVLERNNGEQSHHHGNSNSSNSSNQQTLQGDSSVTPSVSTSVSLTTGPFVNQLRHTFPPGSSSWIWDVSEADIPTVPACYPPMAASTIRTLVHTPLRTIAQTLSDYTRVHSLVAKYDTPNARMECTTADLLKFEIQLWHHPSRRETCRANDNEAEGTNVLSSSTKCMILVEVRRLRGCGIEFHHVRRDLFAVLTRVDFVLRTASTSMASGNTPEDETPAAASTVMLKPAAALSATDQPSMTESISTLVETVTAPSTDKSAPVVTRLSLSVPSNSLAPGQHQRRPSGHIIQMYESDHRHELFSDWDDESATPTMTSGDASFENDLEAPPSHLWPSTELTAKDELDKCIELLYDYDHERHGFGNGREQEDDSNHTDTDVSPYNGDAVVTKLGQGFRGSRTLGCERLSFLTDPSKTDRSVARQVARTIIDGTDDAGRQIRNALEDCFLQESIRPTSAAVSSSMGSSPYDTVPPQPYLWKAMQVANQSSHGGKTQYLALQSLTQSLEMVLMDAGDDGEAKGEVKGDDEDDAGRSDGHGIRDGHATEDDAGAASVGRAGGRPQLFPYVYIDFHDPFWQTVIQRCWHYLERCSERPCVAACAATCLSMLMEYEHRTSEELAELRAAAAPTTTTGAGRNAAGAGNGGDYTERSCCASNASTITSVNSLRDEIDYVYPIVLDAIEYGQLHNLRLEQSSRRLLDVLQRQYVMA